MEGLYMGINKLIEYIEYLKLEHNKKCNVDNSKNIMLDDKVNQFINWYAENGVDGYTDIGQYHAPRDMRNLIEKMAVWYELRYPDYEINRLMPSSSCDNIKINDVMFKDNQYFNGLLDENSDVNYLDWDEFYNAHAFISSLPWEERHLFTRPKYRDPIYLDTGYRDVHLHVTKNGIVMEAEYIDLWTKNIVENKELEGLNVRQVAELLNKRGITLPKNSELSEAIEYADKHIYQKEEMLNCVMYRIIERGGNRIGPRRAFLFAKEFNRNIDIPMIYGVDISDPGLESFVNMYLDAGGSRQLTCLIKYFSRTSDHAKFDTITIEELIKEYKFKIISEVKEQQLIQKKQSELLQKLVFLLSNQIDQSELEEMKEEKKRAEIKQLRLERKLEKNRCTNKE